MKIIKRILPIMVLVIGFIGGIIFYASASIYNSEEISYDNSISHADATNVKDAIDYLYSHGFSTCPEDMTCIESPVVTIDSSGPGSVDKESMHIRINESNTFTVTPNEGYTLASISCTNGYTLSSFKTNQNAASKSECDQPQTITITNPGTTSGATCTITFASYDLSVSSTQLHETNEGDICNSDGVGCVCWYIKNGGSNFTYGTHTGCNFKSNTCKTSRGTIFDCTGLRWYDGTWDDIGIYDGRAACSGVITCAT